MHCDHADQLIEFTLYFLRYKGHRFSGDKLNAVIVSYYFSNDNVASVNINVRCGLSTRVDM